MGSPRLPLEVIERVIDHSNHHPETLRSLSFTCRQLLPRTRLVKFSRVSFKTRALVFTFVDLVLQNPHLKPIVQTVVFSPASFGPSILHILPNISSIEYVSDGIFQAPTLPAQHISLACFHPLGTHIRTLHLSNLCFPTLLSFAQLILAFRRATLLVCEDLEIKTAGDAARLNAIRARLCKEMQLTTVNIDLELLGTGKKPLGSPVQMGDHLGYYRSSESSPMDLNSNAKVGELLFHTKSAVQNLNLRVRYESLPRVLSKDCDWSNLRSLVLRLIQNSVRLHSGIPKVLQLLKNFPKGPSLREVTLEWQLQTLDNLRDIMQFARANGKTCKTLEDALLQFNQPRLVFAISKPAANSRSSWLPELERYFPTLSHRKAVELTYIQSIPAGHDSCVTALAVSPNSKWVVSGSVDMTLILWDASSGAMVQQWVTQSFYLKPVQSLAFSPDSRFLLSTGESNKAIVWDLSLSQDSDALRKVARLEGWGPNGEPNIIMRCTWSLAASTLATGSTVGNVWIWIAHGTKFHLHAVTKVVEGRISSLTFSPDRHWLACASDAGDSYIADINRCRHSEHSTSSLRSNPKLNDRYATTLQAPPVPPVASAAFNWNQRRFALGLRTQGRAMIIVRNTDPGIWERALTVVPRKHEGNVNHCVDDVSFSPDGTMVLGATGHTAHIWNVRGEERCRLNGHKQKIEKAKFSPCGEYVATASEDKTVRLWRARDGVCVARLSEHNHPVEHLAFSPDGTTLSSGDLNGRVIIRRMNDILASTLVRQAGQ